MSTPAAAPAVPKVERRFLPIPAAAPLELRAAAEGALPTIVGYAAVFNRMSEDLGHFIEQIQPGAFAGSIASDDIRALIDHQSSLIIGRNRSGTLRLREDATGLLTEIDPASNANGRNIVESIRRRDVTGMSFGFETLIDSWDFTGEIPIRTLIKVKLYDVGPVTYPAYPDTSVGVRSLEQARASAAPPSSPPTPDPSLSRARARRLLDLSTRRA